MEEETAQPEFWNNPQNSQQVLKEIKTVKDAIDSYNELGQNLEDIELLISLGLEEKDNDLLQEATLSYTEFVKAFDSYNITTLLSGEYDSNSAVLSLNAGAGGTDSCDWVAILLRMYTRYAQNKGYKVEILDQLPGEEAGIKSVTCEITGSLAYGHLKCEKGVHRLVRLSPFDAAGKRHTSFASCSVIPVFDDDINIEIKEEDLKIDTYKSGGAGGQHVNTTDSAIRITHIPSGIVVQCQNQRSQNKNKESAMKILKSKLFEKERQDKANQLKEIKGVEDDIAWGSQIRSYVFHPYNMVKDHRTGEETGNVRAVIDGEIDNFISSYLKYIRGAV